MNAKTIKRIRPSLILSIAGGLCVLPATQAARAQEPPPTGNTRQPIVTNQFTTTTGGALQQRRPGLFIQQGVAVNQGGGAFFDGNVVDERGFIGETIRMILLDILDMINNALSALNLLSGDNPLAGLGDLGDVSGLLDGNGDGVGDGDGDGDGAMPESETNGSDTTPPTTEDEEANALSNPLTLGAGG